MAEIKHNVVINSTAEKIFQALTDQNQLSQWWADCQSEQDTLKFAFEPGNYVLWQVTALIPSQIVHWHCLEHHYNGDTSFIGTDVEFKIVPNGNNYQVQFTHSGWANEDKTFHLCTEGWRHFIQTSLKKFVETGKGEPHSVAVEKIKAKAAKTN